MNLTLRAACWLFYYERGDEVAARAVSGTGLTLGQVERLVLTGTGEHQPQGIIGSDAERAA